MPRQAGSEKHILRRPGSLLHDHDVWECGGLDFLFTKLAAQLFLQEPPGFRDWNRAVELSAMTAEQQLIFERYQFKKSNGQ